MLSKIALTVAAIAFVLAGLLKYQVIELSRENADLVKQLQVQAEQRQYHVINNSDGVWHVVWREDPETLLDMREHPILEKYKEPFIEVSYVTPRPFEVYEVRDGVPYLITRRNYE